MSVRLGATILADDALISIVRGAVAGVEGVRLDRPGRIARALPGRHGAVAWQVEGDTIALDIDVAVSYGTALPSAARGVRDSVAAALTAMTGLRVRTVDVTVTGIGRAEP